MNEAGLRETARLADEQSTPVATRVVDVTDRDAVQAMVGAALMWAALPPLDLWPLAWIAPVWWVLLVRRRELPLLDQSTGKMPVAPCGH